MPLEQQGKKDIAQKIRSFVQDQIEQPFAILRERGAVAELRSRLMTCEGLNTLVKANLINQPRGTRVNRGDSPPSRVVHTNRVQLEITANTKYLSPESEHEVSKALDIVVLSEAPTLYLARNGPGDVIQQVAPTSLSAAIEVKASPSLDKTAGGEYVKDISALLWLATRHNVSAYFVLLDKSDEFYLHGKVHSAALTRDTQWWKDHEDSIVLRYGKKKIPGGKAIHIKTSPQRLGIEIADSEPVSLPYVEIWLPLFDSITGTWKAECKYATLSQGRPNLYIDPAKCTEKMP